MWREWTGGSSALPAAGRAGEKIADPRGAGDFLRRELAGKRPTAMTVAPPIPCACPSPRMAAALLLRRTAIPGPPPFQSLRIMARDSTYLNFPRSTAKAFEFHRTVFGTDYAGPIACFKDLQAQTGQPPDVQRREQNMKPLRPPRANRDRAAMRAPRERLPAPHC